MKYPGNVLFVLLFVILGILEGITSANKTTRELSNGSKPVASSIPSSDVDDASLLQYTLPLWEA